ncbi:hypothetical protein JAAARDRAFT_475340 [Jaapia argillacea MUCL 33604]|uniref:Uncharacterized protein n=1 Tax=Jaapia argillacea MUCL 33604 TaxID=933084 RepID=A0A067PQZ6_9AGAM|nr:hypothetical protein JAAARDRAFT_475340 [Jaapia argillacea MUCL 33604]
MMNILPPTHIAPLIAQPFPNRGATLRLNEYPRGFRNDESKTMERRLRAHKWRMVESEEARKMERIDGGSTSRPFASVILCQSSSQHLERATRRPPLPNVRLQP